MGHLARLEEKVDRGGAWTRAAVARGQRPGLEEFGRAVCFHVPPPLPVAPEIQLFFPESGIMHERNIRQILRLVKVGIVNESMYLHRRDPDATPMEPQPTCLIVGAGMAGLFAARTLHVQACKATILEKSRGVGGRLASRRVDDLTFDHGAQHIHARSAVFKVYVQAAEQTRVLRHWTSAFPDTAGSQQVFPSPVLRGHPAMTAFPKRIAFDLLIHLQQRVTAARVNNGAWSIDTDSGHVYMAQALVLTAPVPQSLALLEAGGVTLPSDVARQLQAVVYVPCIVLMIGLETPSGIPEPGGLVLDGDPLSWIADNHAKGVSASPGALTIFAGEQYSTDHLADTDEAIVSELLPHVRRIVPVPVRTAQVHRWRFARPKTYLPIPFAIGGTEPPLLFAGDVFGLGNAEGAALSGMAAAEFLQSTFCPGP